MAAPPEDDNPEQEVQENDELQEAQENDELTEMEPEDFVPQLGTFDGETYSLKCFASGVGGCLQGGDGEGGPMSWEQTMGSVAINYCLVDDEASLDEDRVKVEASRTQLRVSVGESTKQSKNISNLCGQLSYRIRPASTWWQIIDRSDLPGAEYCNEEQGKILRIVLKKFDHREWRTIWNEGKNVSFQRHSFPWTRFGTDELQRSKAEEKLQQIEAEEEEDSPELLPSFAFHKFCVPYDDVEDYPDWALVYVHLDKDQLDKLQESAPLEDLFGADITEKCVKVFLKITGTNGENLSIFEGELVDRCVPEETWWELTMDRKCFSPGMQGYHAAVKLWLHKHPNSERDWGKVFKSSTYAGGAARLKDVPAASDVKALPAPQQPPLFDPEKLGKFSQLVVTNFNELFKDGLSSAEATTKAIEMAKNSLKFP